MDNKRIAVITGGNRGIGFEVCRQLARDHNDIKVVLTARDEAKGTAASEELRKSGAGVIFHRLDVGSETSVKDFSRWIESEFGRWDILVNNAAVMPDLHKSVLDMEAATFRESLNVNFFGALLMSQAAISLMRRNNYGRIVNVSSGAGAFSRGMGPDHPAYRITKASLNALTRILAGDVKDTNILVNVMTPGWILTDMGSQLHPQGWTKPVPIEEGAETIVWLATLPDGGPSGCFFRKHEQVPW